MYWCHCANDAPNQEISWKWVRGGPRCHLFEIK